MRRSAWGPRRCRRCFHHVLPLAMPGILTGTIIGLAQALGETAPLLLIGMVASWRVVIPTGSSPGSSSRTRPCRRRSTPGPQRADVAFTNGPGAGYRPLGLRQVHLPALPQPDERHHPGCRVTAPSCSTARRSTTVASTWCRCAPRSAWCSRSPTRSRSPSTRTSPTARASTAWRPAAELDEIVETSLRRAGLWDEVKDRLDSPAPGCPAASSSGCASPAPSPCRRR
jgi:hypothetical protein